MIKIFGKTEGTGFPHEDNELMTFINQVRKKYSKESELMTHIKNEGKRNVFQYQKDKAKGLNSGFADIVIIGNPTFVCELKSKNYGSKPSKKQMDFLNSASDVGAFACVAYGYDNAMLAFKEWLSMQAWHKHA